MKRRMSREERKAAYMKAAEQLFEEMEDWYDEHPEASFEAIEQRARESRRQMMGESLKIFVNGRDAGQLDQKPYCEECGQMMSYKGEVPKTVYGVEGETRLERAYYCCPNSCKGTAFFPSG
jgi:hypothetical protein